MKKKIYILILLSFAAMGTQAQKLELSALGSYQSTWIFNQNISDKGDIQDYAAGWGYNYGLGVGFYFNNKIGMEVDGLFDLHSGNYTGTDDSNRTYTSNVKLHMTNIPLLFKLRSSNGAYFEVGPQFSMISHATYSYKQSYYNASTGNNVDTNNSVNVSNMYATSDISAVIGFGVKIKFGSHLSMKTGLRLTWGLADLKGVDALGNDLNNPFLYKDKRATNSASGGLLIGLTWSFGDTEDSGPKPPPPPPTGN